MTDAELRYQADKLAQYVWRGGNADRWFLSKDFSRRDQRAIERLLVGVEEVDGELMF